MVSKSEIVEKSEVKYKSVPPDGGWGYLITASVTIMNLVTVVPIATFGLVYGNFLTSIGDETTGTTLANGFFNTVQSFTGLATNFLLKKYSYRKVGLVGAVLYFSGAFAAIFVTNLTQLIIAFGLLQGLGFGLMTPSTLSALTCYFEKKLNLMMGIAQAIMVLAAIAFPPTIAFLVDYLGFRGGIAFLAGLTLLNFPAMAVLQPVKWHMKRIPLQVSTINNEKLSEVNNKPLKGEVLTAQIEPLLQEKAEQGLRTKADSTTVSKFEKNIVTSERRASIISLGNAAVSINALDKIEIGQQKKASPSLMDLSLLKDLKYLNVSCGVALGFTSDVAFNSIIPMVLSNIGFSKSYIAFLLVVYFGSDLVSRILFSVASALCKIRNRYVFLAGAFFSAVFRIAFILNDTERWKMITLGALGFLRCFIQTPLALVIAEEYNDIFPTAFSLYMVICGFVSLIFGPLMSFVKSITGSDVMVIHVLTAAYLLCSISWTIELVWTSLTGFKQKRSRN